MLDGKLFDEDLSSNWTACCFCRSTPYLSQEGLLLTASLLSLQNVKADQL